MKFRINGRMTPKNKKLLAREFWVCEQIILAMGELIKKNTGEKYFENFYADILSSLEKDELVNDDVFVVDLKDFKDVFTEQVEAAKLVLEESSEDESELAVKFFNEALKKHNGDTIKAFEESARKIEDIIASKENKEKEEENTVFNPKKVWDITDLLLELDPKGGEF